MPDLIKNLDRLYGEACKKYNINTFTKDFSIYMSVSVTMQGKAYDDFIIKKGQFTKFLYTKNGCRVYFSDADILEMLLQIKSSVTIRLLLKELSKMYYQDGIDYCINVDGNTYTLRGINEIDDDQILHNPQDIDISFKELVILINLILAKDMESVEIWKGKTNFLKHTISKYISIIKYYYFQDVKAKQYLKEMGYDIDSNIYSNYNTPQKRDDKIHFFCDFKTFEKIVLL